jgi:hypothetical protein
MVTGRDRRTYYVLGALGVLSGLLTEPAQRLLMATIGDAELHNHITIDRLLSGLPFGIALLAGLAYLMRFKPRKALIPLITLAAFFLAMETWVILAPRLDKSGITAVETSELRRKCEELAASTAATPADPALLQACEQLKVSDEQGATLGRLQSLPGAGLTYGLAGLIGALLTYLGTAYAAGRAPSARGSLIVLAVGALAAAGFGLALVGLQLETVTPLFVTWQPSSGRSSDGWCDEACRQISRSSSPRQTRLNFRPLPQGQGSLRPVLPAMRFSWREIRPRLRGSPARPQTDQPNPSIARSCTSAIFGAFCAPCLSMNPRMKGWPSLSSQRASKGRSSTLPSPGTTC